MKIQLVAINAKYIHSNLAVYCLEAYAAERGICVERKEYTINHNADDILAKIYIDQPDVVCFSCYIWNIQFVKELARELKKILPKIDIWVGGPEVSYDAEEFLRKEPTVLGVMRQEGEETFFELCKCYEQNWEGIKDVKGITYRVGESIITNPDREPMDLNQLPFPYKTVAGLENRIFYYESSRGCPFSCSYCLSSIDKKLRFKEADKVYKELDVFLKWKVPQVKFVDRTFNAKKEHAIGIWKYLQENDNGVTNFHFEVAADILTEEELLVLESLRPGLVQLEIGVQSTNGATLKEVRRKTELDRIWNNVDRLLKINNCHIHLDLIAGLPRENYESFCNSFNELYEHHPHQLQLGFLKVLKGSYMDEKKEDYEIAFHDRPPYEVLKTKWISYEEILRLKKVEEMVELYYNSGQHKTMLKLLEQRFENGFSLYEKLAEFYGQKLTDGGNPSRIKKSEIILEFAVSVDEERTNLYKQAALFDLYLRENLKSRPVMALPLSKEQSALKKQNGISRHMEMFDYNFADSEVFGKKMKTIVIFHYDERNPITWDARVEVIE